MRALNLCAALVAACLLPVQFYDAADAFGDLRDPAEERILPARGDGDYELADIPDGSIAVLVYHDENANGRLDKNFIGIPREPLAISNNYQPKGPPTFSRASVEVPPGATVTMELEMYRVLGERGRLGLGVAAITRSSPYVGASGTVVQPIPAITYVGERLQWLGPTLRFGIAGSGKLRLAAAAEYRIGAYEEADNTKWVRVSNSSCCSSTTCWTKLAAAWRTRSYRGESPGARRALRPTLPTTGSAQR
jgi:outer membrane protein